MQKKFNTAGPCVETRHYMLPPAERVAHLRSLIDDMSYFVLHAPRQVGKTTSMMALAKELTASGRYASLVVTCEQGAAFRNDLAGAERAILASWHQTARETLSSELQPPAPPLTEVASGNALRSFLGLWSEHCPRPLVLFIDEIDALENETLISVLRQLRAGFPGRPAHFPHSIALFGMRDVRDYKVASGGSDRLNTASPFNVKSDSLMLRNFNRNEVFTLLRQHTDATSQVFEPEALEAIWQLTRGQPWLTNALCRQLVEVVVPDRSMPIQLAHVEDAKEILIKRRDTHLDSLAERLREDRVKRLLIPMIRGELLPDIPDDDIRFVQDLGLMENRPGEGLVIANPIYAQIIPRVLTNVLEINLGGFRPTWLNADGTLSLQKLQESFLKFWRQHGAPLLRAAPYAEVAPQLVLMAFLHRVANGDGRVEREYAIGSGRLDLLLDYRGVRLAIECKVQRPDGNDPLSEGLEQLDEYLSGLGWPEGGDFTDSFQAWLFITERRELPPTGPLIPKIDTTRTLQQRQVLVIWG